MADWTVVLGDIVKEYFVLILILAVVIVVWAFKAIKKRNLQKQAQDAMIKERVAERMEQNEQRMAAAAAAPQQNVQAPVQPAPQAASEPMPAQQQAPPTQTQLGPGYITKSFKNPEKIPGEAIMKDVNDKYFGDMFKNAGEPSPPEQELVQNIRSVTDVIKKQSNELNSGITNDLTILREKLIELGDKKEQIRKYGLQLADLFKQYEARENQMALMLIGLEDMAKRNGQIRK